MRALRVHASRTAAQMWEVQPSGLRLELLEPHVQTLRKLP